MARRDDVAVAELECAPTPGASENPRAVFAVGRGGRGKTVVDRWMIDRALNQGRQIIVADADRTNQTLAAFFGELVLSRRVRRMTICGPGWMGSWERRLVNGSR